MQPDDIKIVGQPLFLSTNAEVDEAESQLGIRFPSGYREYITRFGEGILGGTYIRIYPPRRVLTELREWRKRINEYWFWDEGREILAKEKALESIIIGDTFDGDELIVHPGNSEKIYVLPRNSDNVYDVGEGLFNAMEWLCTAGVLTDPFAERNFEPFDSSKQE